MDFVVVWSWLQLLYLWHLTTQEFIKGTKHEN